MVFHFWRQGRAMADARATGARLSDLQALSEGQQAEAVQLREELSEVRAERAQLATELQLQLQTLEERSARWQEDRQRLVGEFAELSATALRQNAEQFLTLADTRLKEAQEASRGDLAQRQQAIDALLVPLRETLGQYQEGLRQVESARQRAYVSLSEQVKQLGSGQERLQRETHSLVTALRSPQTRGRWGEVQLRRVVEMAGMVRHCDFEEQVSTETDGIRLRPDLVVRLPGEGRVVVDAKVPLDAYLRSIDAEDEDARRTALVAHARQVRSHVDELSKKEYWSRFERSPEFVVAFIPGDPLLAAAYEHDPALIEHAMAHRVVLATPTSLIALLSTVAHVWREESLAENAQQVQRLGAELYDRLRVAGGHLDSLQRNLSSSVDSFNRLVGSLESRVLVTARQFPELGVVSDGKDIKRVEPIDSLPRVLQSPEFVDERPAPIAPVGVGRGTGSILPFGASGGRAGDEAVPDQDPPVGLPLEGEAGQPG